MIPPYKFRSVATQEISEIIWAEKYRAGEEACLADTLKRVADGVYANDEDNGHKGEALSAMIEGYWLPAGRIIAGAGTEKRVTLSNCFVNADLPDSMPGIMEGLNTAAYTQQMGGGIGTSFGTIRPSGALVKRTASISSGVIPFMQMYDAMASTIESSGSRRAAMMATLPCWHPDIHAFIAAKQEAGVLTNFNVSVMVTNDFMRAVREDDYWDLKFTVPRADEDHVTTWVANGQTWYVYERLRARALWEEILRGTYEFSEPGVIFMDRVNEQNPLHYCETISCTNPCGEQPLPPFGNCTLGHVNLAFMVRDPFTPEARFDWELLGRVTRIGTRFLDNVLDVCQYPTEEFTQEAQAKRRVGLGYTGLANALQQMGMRYGSSDAVAFTERVGSVIADQAYLTSAELAAERGSFPEYKAEEHVAGDFVGSLHETTQDAIVLHGLRNGVLLTIAPVGTGSLLVGNVSSGLEPSFAWSFKRKVRRSHGATDLIDVEDFGFRLWKHLNPHGDALTWANGSMVKATELTVDEHIRMQAAAQTGVDASVSKTVNCPEGMTFEEFKQVYELAWNLNLKGCTTYRPSAVRGSILTETAEEPVVEGQLISEELAERPDRLDGNTYKVRWPLTQDTFYVTLNNATAPDGRCRPFEIFVTQKTAQHQEWIAALARTLSAVFRREFSHSGSVTFLVAELKSTYAATGGGWIDGKLVPSIPAMLGGVLDRHLRETCDFDEAPRPALVTTGTGTEKRGEVCHQCGELSLIHKEGCASCLSCGFSLC